MYQMGDSVASGKRLAVGSMAGVGRSGLARWRAMMVPWFEALAALLSVLQQGAGLHGNRGADGEKVFRILSGKYPEYLAENAVPFRGERAL